MLLLDDSHDVALLHNKKVFAINFNFSTRPFSIKDFVALFNVESLYFPVIAPSTIADGNDFALLWLLLCCIRDDDAAGGFFLRRLAARPKPGRAEV